jgi:hypothetical protein
MSNFKYIAAVLALLGAVGSAQANAEVKNTQKQIAEKDTIQFMDNKGLSDINGARKVFLIKLKQKRCATSMSAGHTRGCDKGL